MTTSIGGVAGRFRSGSVASSEACLLFSELDPFGPFERVLSDTPGTPHILRLPTPVRQQKYGLHRRRQRARERRERRLIGNHIGCRQGRDIDLHIGQGRLPCRRASGRPSAHRAAPRAPAAPVFIRLDLERLEVRAGAPAASAAVTAADIALERAAADLAELLDDPRSTRAPRRPWQVTQSTMRSRPRPLIPTNAP